ncbi:lasso peptide biosynthesis PqqD family chaperone [Amycolatopsis silviterrae]|uniref:Lasso peptide biosynthesis PqqD family chaperone n=1 Tax=Amycolatopsis silviterrae TaxID=1656914 RepID=A0ABW5H8B8_9PSEU
MTLRLAPHVNLVDTGEGTVMLSENDGRYFQLNRTAAISLKLLLDGKTLAEAADRLRGSASPAFEEIIADLEHLVGSLREAKLVLP